MSEFNGQHVVVTGATGGLGARVVERLLEAGATVHVPMIEADVPTRAPFGHARLLGATRVAADDEASLSAFYASLPRLDASIHLVGGFTMGPLLDTSLADLEHLLALNVKSCFLSCREAVRAMRRSGGSGRIVNVAARPALEPPGPGMVAYTTTKSAVVGLTRAVSAEVAPEGIFVNAIAPSIIDTPANRAAMPDADHASWPTPAQIAETITYLASRANHLTSGAVVPVYGRT